LQYFENLSELRISGFWLTSIPDLGNLSSLDTLWLWNIEIPSLSEDFFFGLTSLKVLGIMDCNFFVLPDMSALNNLSNFSIYSCPELEFIPEFSNSFALNELLYIAHCEKLTTIPQILNQDSLKVLHLAYLPLLTEIPELPIGISRIFLFNTGVNTIPELINLTNLTDIDIINNYNLGIIPDLPINLSLAYINNPNLICIGTYPDALESSLGHLPKCSDGIIYQIEESFSEWYISISLSEGWNMFGYGCPSPIDVVDGLSNHTESILITKDNNGSVYMPEFGFNGIGDFTPGFGYQIKVTEAIEGFSLCNWYVNYIPIDTIISLQQENNILLDNIVSLQEENASLQAELDSIYGCIDEVACNYDLFSLVNDGSCNYSEHGYDCEGNLSAQIGDEFQGGILIYIDGTGEHGLVAATEDLTEGSTFSNELGYNGYEWGCIGVSVEGADSYYGYQNTMDIVNQGCSTENGGITASQAALDYVSEGYSDWFLPSFNDVMYLHTFFLNTLESGGDLGNFTMAPYWTSNDGKIIGSDSDFNALSISFYSELEESIRSSILPVRPIRYF
jgi:hypothetical protein